MKKTLLFIVCFMLLVSSVSIAFSEEGFDITAEADKTTAVANEEVTIIVKLINTPASTSGSIDVLLSEGLELVSGEMLQSENVLIKSFDQNKNKGVIRVGSSSSFDGDYAKIVVRVIDDSVDNNVTLKVMLNPSGLNNTTTVTIGKPQTGLFAGWYKDAEFNEYYTETPGEDSEKYAKYVDPEILGLKFQLKNNASADDEKTVVRVLTSVDTLNYKNVGFVVKYVNGAGEQVERTFETNKVYKKITGTTDLESFDYTPDVFSPDSTSFCAFNLTVPQSLFGTTINYTSFWTTMDGTVVFGESGNLTISEHISHE